MVLLLIQKSPMLVWSLVCCLQSWSPFRGGRSRGFVGVVISIFVFVIVVVVVFVFTCVFVYASAFTFVLIAVYYHSVRGRIVCGSSCSSRGDVKVVGAIELHWFPDRIGTVSAVGIKLASTRDYQFVHKGGVVEGEAKFIIQPKELLLGLLVGEIGPADSLEVLRDVRNQVSYFVNT